jgi:hypothetical protein
MAGNEHIIQQLLLALRGRSGGLYDDKLPVTIRERAVDQEM